MFINLNSCSIFLVLKDYLKENIWCDTLRMLVTLINKYFELSWQFVIRQNRALLALNCPLIPLTLYVDLSYRAGNLNISRQ